MQKLFPSLLWQYNNHNFACDACEFAKHKHVSYQSSLNRNTTPFIIIHSDVWDVPVMSLSRVIGGL